MKKEEHILRIYIDESGDNGDAKGSSELYGYTLVFWDNKNDISKELNKLNDKLNNINFTGMIHMSELVKSEQKCQYMSLKERKTIFNYLFYFYKNSNIKSKSFYVKKKETLNRSDLNLKLSSILKTFIIDNYEYLSSFDKVVVYYDNGQKPLGKIFDECFNYLNNYVHYVHFDKEKERLFQVADMITYLDKIYYKRKNKMNFGKSEKYFFNPDEIKTVTNTLDMKLFKTKKGNY